MNFVFDTTISLGLIFTVVAAAVGWVRLQNKRIDTRIDVNGQRLDRQEARLAAAEQTLQSLPGKTDLHALQLLLERMSGDMREMRASMSGQQQSMTRLENVVGRQEDHLLNRVANR